jgi:hypothetical protein
MSDKILQEDGFGLLLEAGSGYLVKEDAAALDIDFTTGALDSRITFTRGSAATQYGADGLLRNAPHNLIFRSQEFDNSAWTNAFSSPGITTANATTAPDGTLTADKLANNNGTTNYWAAAGTSSGLTISPTVFYTFSVYLKAAERSSNIQLSGDSAGPGLQANSTFNLSAGTVSTSVGTAAIVDAGNGWWRCSVTGVLSTSDGTHPFVRDLTNGDASGSGFYAWGAQLERNSSPSLYIPTTSAASYDGPRFDYDPASLAARGLLLEEQRTNVVLWSRDLSNAAWTKSNITATQNQTGCDGIANSATSITATAANGTVLQAITLASSARAQSASVKRLTGSGTIEMTMDGGATWTAIAVTSGWTSVAIPTQTLANPSVGFRIATSGDAVAIDLVQNENGTLATSYIPTTTVAVTRTADTAEMTGTNFSSWWNASAGTFVAEYRPQSVSGTQPVISVNDTTANEAIRLYGSGTDPKAIIVDGGATQADLDAGTIAANANFYKLGLAFTLNDFAACLDGGTVATDTAGTLPTVTQLQFHTDIAGNIANLHIKRLQFFNTRKSDSELQALTAPSSIATTETITAGTIGIVGQAISDVFGRVDAITPSAIPIGGATIADAFGRIDAITPSAIPIGGATIADSFSIVEPALTASAIPIGGANITEAFGRVDAITPSAIPIGGATIADAFGRVDAITPSAIPIGGATIADSYGIVDAITPSAIPIGGATIADSYGIVDAITPSAIPIGGSTITEGTTGAYVDSISPSPIPITGATISVTATWADAITAGAIPIDGATITDSLVSGAVDYSDTLTPASLPIEGSNVVSIFGPTVVEPRLKPGIARALRSLIGGDGMSTFKAARDVALGVRAKERWRISFAASMRPKMRLKSRCLTLPQRVRGWRRRVRALGNLRPGDSGRLFYKRLWPRRWRLSKGCSGPSSSAGKRKCRHKPNSKLFKRLSWRRLLNGSAGNRTT